MKASRLIRILIFTAPVVVLLVIWLVHYASLRVESSHLKTLVAEYKGAGFKEIWQSSDLPADIIKNPPYQLKRQGLKKNARAVDLYLFEWEVRCEGFKLMAVGREGLPMAWQWDYRFLQSSKKGRQYALTHVPHIFRNILKGNKDQIDDHYKIWLNYNSDCVELVGVWFKEVESLSQVPQGLFYNDVVFKGAGSYKLALQNGYKVMEKSQQKLLETFGSERAEELRSQPQ